MSTRTLANIEAAFRYEYDLGGFLARHPSADILRLLNDAYRELRERLTADGATVFLNSIELTTTSSGKSSNVPGTLVAYLSFGVATTQPFPLITRVDCFDGGRWRELQRLSYNDVLNNSDGVGVGTPRAWCEYTADETQTGTDLSQGPRILLVPPTSGPCQLRITGLSAVSDMISSSPLYLEFGMDQFMMAKAAAIVAEREGELDVAQFRFARSESIYQALRKRMMSRVMQPAPVAHTRQSIVGRRRVRGLG